MKKVLFVNEWGYPDIHITREFCKKTLVEIKENEKDVTAKYFCFKDPDLLVDICPITTNQGDFTHFDSAINKEDNLILNTHHSTLDAISPNNEKINRFERTYDLFKHFHEHYLNRTMEEITNFIPSIDYESFCCILPAYLSDLKLDDERCILFDTSFSEYDFGDNLAYESIVENLAKNNKDKKIFITEINEKLDQIENVLNTRKIFPFFCNVNEVSWLSLHCRTIIGKTKDYFTASLVKENVFNKNKKFINIIENDLDVIIPPNFFKGEYIKIDYRETDKINENI